MVVLRLLKNTLFFSFLKDALGLNDESDSDETDPTSESLPEPIKILKNDAPATGDAKGSLGRALKPKGASLKAQKEKVILGKRRFFFCEFLTPISYFSLCFCRKL